MSDRMSMNFRMEWSLCLDSVEVRGRWDAKHLNFKLYLTFRCQGRFVLGYDPLPLSKIIHCCIILLDPLQDFVQANLLILQMLLLLLLLPLCSPHFWSDAIHTHHQYIHVIHCFNHGILRPPSAIALRF